MRPVKAIGMPYIVFAAPSAATRHCQVLATLNAHRKPVTMRSCPGPRQAGSGVTFTHALVHEAIAAGVRPSQRRQWHRRTGETLAARPNADPDAVASHFVRAGDRRAVAWLTMAGEWASHSYAWLTAAKREVGIGTIPHEPTTASALR